MSASRKGWARLKWRSTMNVTARPAPLQAIPVPDSERLLLDDGDDDSEGDGVVIVVVVVAVIAAAVVLVVVAAFDSGGDGVVIVVAFFNAVCVFVFGSCSFLKPSMTPIHSPTAALAKTPSEPQTPNIAQVAPLR